MLCVYREVLCNFFLCPESVRNSLTWGFAGRLETSIYMYATWSQRDLSWPLKPFRKVSMYRSSMLIVRLVFIFIWSCYWPISHIISLMDSRVALAVNSLFQKYGSLLCLRYTALTEISHERYQREKTKVLNSREQKRRLEKDEGLRSWTSQIQRDQQAAVWL